MFARLKSGTNSSSNTPKANEKSKDSLMSIESVGTFEFEFIDENGELLKNNVENNKSLMELFNETGQVVENKSVTDLSANKSNKSKVSSRMSMSIDSMSALT